MKRSEIEALYFNWADELEEDYEDTREDAGAVNQMVEASGLPFMEADRLRCAINKHAERCQHQGFMEGFKAAVSLILTGGGFMPPAI